MVSAYTSPSTWVKHDFPHQLYNSGVGEEMPEPAVEVFTCEGSICQAQQWESGEGQNSFVYSNCFECQLMSLTACEEQDIKLR